MYQVSSLCCFNFPSSEFQVFYGLSLTATAISQSGGLAPDSTKAKSGASSIFALLDRQSKIDSSDNSGMTLENVKGNIEFRHVSFNYPSRPEAQVLKDLCLIISSGEVNSNALFS